jgi:dihydroneopterin aldolase
VSDSWLRLRGIHFDAILGCHPAERTTPRPVEVDLSVRLDITPAAQSDTLSDTLDTETLENLVLDTAQSGKYNLIETLAHAIATRVLALPLVQSVHVTVHKPASLPHTRTVTLDLILP